MSAEKSVENFDNRSNRRTFIRQLAVAAGGLTLAPELTQLAFSQKQPAAKPNILFILGEGVRPDEFSLAGNKILQTPNMDRIGREGVVFKNAFVVNALCLPSRATILTGLYSHTTGAVDNQDSHVPKQFPILSDLLRDAGYEVAFIGKSHVEGALRDHYWDYYFGFNGQADYYHPRITEGVQGKYQEAKRYDGYVDEILTEKALAWLDKKREKPFCLFLWFYAPHAPFYRPRRFVDLYNGVSIPKPPTFDDWKKGYPGKPKAFVDADNKIGIAEVGSDDARSLEELVKDHYAGVASNDENVGKIMHALERQNALDDTAIMLSSDHGFFLGEFALYDKRLMHEPSIRVPLMVRYPQRIQPGTTCDKMVLNLDLAPTLLDLVGLNDTPTMQGKRASCRGWKERP